MLSGRGFAREIKKTIEKLKNTEQGVEMKMKRILSLSLLFFIILFSFPVYSSDWTAVSKTDRGIVYIDEASISKKSGYVYYKTLSNNKKRTNEGALSLIMLNKADCNKFKFMPFILEFYEGSMGSGKLLGRVDEGAQWLSVKTPYVSKMGIGSAFKLVCSYMENR